MRKLVSFAGLAAAFIVAFACQRWAYHLQESVSSSFRIESYLWLSSLTVLIAATPVILLSWYVLHSATKDAWVSSVFAVAGIAVTFGYAIAASLHSYVTLGGRGGVIGPPLIRAVHGGSCDGHRDCVVLST
jgi:hypothetical protein